MSAAYQSVFAAAEKLEARACCVIASRLETVTPRWACRLAQPLLEEDVDLVVPHYARRKFEGLLNSSIISPLTRCLYGKRIHNPMGPDLGVSRRLFQKMLGPTRMPASRGIACIRWRPLHLPLSATICRFVRCMSERAFTRQRIGRI